MFKKILTLLITLLFQENVFSATFTLPDPCTMAPRSGAIVKRFPFTSSSQFVVYREESLETLGKTVPIVLITNGNGYGPGFYEELAEHLARNGFLVIDAGRPEGAYNQKVFIDKAIKKVIQDYEVSNDSPVGLIGHSVGGEVVINAAKYNSNLSKKLNISAVMTIAPNTFVTNINKLNQSHTDAYFTIYGSQDHDMKGFGQELRESFATFNWAGTEYTTFSGSGSVPQSSNRMEKTMIFVHGADHAGLIGADKLDGNTSDDDDYISLSDQFCITKAYANSFMRWKLRNQIFYKSYINGTIIPKSVNEITSYRYDFKGNPANTPLLLKFQNSAKYRHSIENFEDNSYNLYYKTPTVLATKTYKNEHSSYPHYIRDFTNSLLLRWRTFNQYGYFAFDVTFPDRFHNSYKYLSLRIGQLWNGNLYHENSSNKMYGNGINKSQDIYIGLRDSDGNFSWKPISILPNDKRNFSLAPVGKTELSSFRIPVSAFKNVDLKKVTAIYLAFKRNSQGSILIDNIEWVKD